jgi:hypothetical protein
MEQITLEQFLVDYESGLIQDVFVVDKTKRLYGRIVQKSNLSPPGITYKVVWVDVK